MTDQSLKYIARRLPLALAGAVLAACSAPSAEKAAPPVVLVAEVGAGTEAGAVVTGTVESRAHHVISSEAGGRLISVSANVGDRVTKGRVLAVIDPQRGALQLNQAEADLGRARADLAARQAAFDRAEKLVGDGTVSQADYERAKAEALSAARTVEAATSARALAARTVNEGVIRAPADGVIVSRTVQPSQAAAPGATLFELEGGGTSDIHALVPAAEARRLVPGQAARFVSASGSGTARVSGISTQAVAGGAVEVRFTIDGAAPASGTAVSIDLASGPGVGVPLTAVSVAPSGMRRVFTVDRNSRIKAVPVTVTSVSGQQAVVAADLAQGTRIVIAGTDWVRSGMSVRPQFATR